MQIISACYDLTIRLWDLAVGKTIATETNRNKSVRGLVAHPQLFMFPVEVSRWQIYPESVGSQRHHQLPRPQQQWCPDQRGGQWDVVLLGLEDWLQLSEDPGSSAAWIIG